MILFLGATAHAATFVVPRDAALVIDATAIVIATPLSTHTELRNNAVETVTTLSIEKVLKGTLPRHTLEIDEPGGASGGRTTIIAGAPRFRTGDRYLLLLVHTNGGLWRVLDLALGAFRFERDANGAEVLVRDSSEIAGWDPNGRPHQEPVRPAREYLDFVTAIAGGQAAREPDARGTAPNTVPSDASRSYTPASYTYLYGGAGEGARWNTFPSPVNFYSTNANAAAVDALRDAIASWNGNAGSDVDYVYAGADTSGAHNGGVTTPDGQNTVAFERNLADEYGAMPFTCAPGSYGGTLGVGAVTNASGTHVGPDGERFYTTVEADVEMNQGLSACAYFIGIGDFDSAVAHELGHTLGFRHADEERPAMHAASCSGDASVECSTTAIMNATIPTGLHGALQPWDRRAEDAVYPHGAVFATSATATMAHAARFALAVRAGVRASRPHPRDVSSRGIRRSRAGRDARRVRAGRPHSD